MHGLLKGIKGLEGLTREDAEKLVAFINAMSISKENLLFENLEIEKVQLDITGAAQTVTTQHTTSTTHKLVVGVAMNITDEAVLEGATFSLSIDSKEVFPTGTEAKLLFASTAVAPNDKFYNYLKREINQTRVDFSFTSNAFTNNYSAILYLLCVKN